MSDDIADGFNKATIPISRSHRGASRSYNTNGRYYVLRPSYKRDTCLSTVSLKDIEILVFTSSYLRFVEPPSASLQEAQNRNENGSDTLEKHLRNLTIVKQVWSSGNLFAILHHHNMACTVIRTHRPQLRYLTLCEDFALVETTFRTTSRWVGSHCDRTLFVCGRVRIGLVWWSYTIHVADVQDYSVAHNTWHGDGKSDRYLE